MVEIVRNRNIRVSFVSNGSFFTKSNVEKIVELGVSRVYVSLESANPQIFQEIRGGKFSKVRRGIESLISTREKMGARDPSVGLALTVLKKTQHELQGVLDLYHELGLDGGIVVQPLQTMDSYVTKYDDKMHLQILDDIDMKSFEEFEKSEELISINRAKRGVGFYEEIQEEDPS